MTNRSSKLVLRCQHQCYHRYLEKKQPTDFMKFLFSGFTYDTEQKILKHGSQTIELTKKNHTLLSFLLTKPNQLISREELIDEVWQGRVVTNNTIDQCILKLRRTLNHVHEAEYIETVYGQGIRFLPDIELPQETPIIAAKPNKQKVWIGMMLVTLLIPVVYWLLTKQNTHAIEALDVTLAAHQVSPTPLPIQAAEDDWLLYGGSSYLSYLLHLYPNINLQNTQRNKATEAQKPNLVLELIRANQAKQMIQIVLYQQLSPDNEINSYYADISLINQGENSAHIQLTASQLTVLFPQIATWVAQLDTSEASTQVIDQNIFTQNEQALLNYFRGLVGQITGDSELALKYFKTAVDLDPGFKVAWYELAIATSKQGDKVKAISVLNSIDSHDQWLTYRAAIAKAITYGELKDSNAAIEAYAVALQIAETSNDKFKMAVIYNNQAILFSNMKQYEQAEHQLILAIENTDSVMYPGLYGSAMHTYAKVAKHMSNLPLAVEKIESAIKAYQTAGDTRYEMQSKTRLAGLLLDSNELNQAELLVKESLSYAKQLNNLSAVSSNRTTLAIIYQNTGRFDLAVEQWQAVIALNTELNTSDNNAEVYYWLMRLHLAANNPSQAAIVLDTMQQWANESPSTERQAQLAEVSFMHALYQHDIQKAQQLMTQMKSNTKEKLLVYQGDLARLVGDEQLAESYYLDAAELLTQQGLPNQLTDVLNRLNDLYLTFEVEKLAHILDRTSRLKPFIYPYQKYQAHAAKSANNYIEALSLMEELKLKAGDFWQPDDQLLLESIKKSQQ